MLVLSVSTSAFGQASGVLGTGVPKAGGSPLQIVGSDVTFLGYYNVPNDGTGGVLQGDFSFAFGGGAIKKVAGVNHFYINQSDSSGCISGAACDGSPVEFSEPATWSAAGVCTGGNCPNTTLASGPNITYVTNWGLNDDLSHVNGSDFYHGLYVDYWADDGSNVLKTDCVCKIYYSIITPSGDYVSSSGIVYGNTHPFGGGFLVTFDSNSAGVRTTTAYGPIVFQTSAGYVGTQYTGEFAARYFSKMPDGSFCFGAGDSGQAQQGSAPNGPILFCAASWPTSSTTVAYNARFSATSTNMRFYNEAPFAFADGTPGIAPIVSYRHPFLYPYVSEVQVGAPHSQPCNPYSNQGACEALDPLQNAGIGTWTETSHVTGIVPIKTLAKQGVIGFMSTGTNHTLGNTTSCMHAHPWYCAGGPMPSCAGDGGGYAGTQSSPRYGCPVGYQVTGPTTTTTGQEAQWPIFSWTDMLAVATGAKTDYTVDPVESIFPEVAFSLVVPPTSNASVLHHTVPIGYDTDTNLLYVLIPQIVQIGCCIHQPAIAVFHVAQ